MSTSDHAPGSRSAGLLPLWFGLLTGPVVWSLHLLIGLVIVAAACGSGFASFAIGGAAGWQVVLLLFTFAAAAITLIAGFVSWDRWRAVGLRGDTAACPPAGRDRFLALSGVLMSGLFCAAILLVAVALFAIDHCQ